MARLFFGGSGADVIARRVAEDDDTLQLLLDVTYDVYTARTGGTQITDLLDAAGAPITEVTPDESGVRFKGPSGRTAGLWLQNQAEPTEPRWLVTAADQDPSSQLELFNAALERLQEICFNVKDYGALGVGTDDTAYIQAAIDATQPTGTTGIRGAIIVFPPGEYCASDSIAKSKFNGTFQGCGTGNPPTHSSPGFASVIRWIGDDAHPLFKLNDYSGVTFDSLRLEGNDATPPTYLIESNRLTGEGTGTNAYLTVRGCWLGAYTWSTQGTEKGAAQVGIGFTGNNGNNDQFSIENTVISHCDTGVYVPNTQSIWGRLDNVTITTCSIAGVQTSASMVMFNPQFDNCAIDVYVDDNCRVDVFKWNSERSGLILKADLLAKVNVFGGLWTLTTPYITAGANFIEHDTATAGSGVALRGVGIVNQTGGAHPKIYVRAEGGGGSNPGYLRVEDCGNLTITEFDVASTVSDALEVYVETGSLSVHQRLDGAQTFTGVTSDGAWGAYTPTLAGSGWAVGNGVLTGSYVEIGHTVHWEARLTFGTTTTAGSVAPTITLPVAGKANRYGAEVRAVASEAGVGNHLLQAWGDSPLTKVQLFYGDGFAGVDSTHPFSWGTGDVLYLSGTYEAA